MAFTGLSVYSSGVFNTAEEDLSDVISMISPHDTPLLDALAQAPGDAINVLHEWLEEDLGPNTVVNSTAHANTSDATFAIAGGLAAYLQAGHILKNTTTGEHVIVTSISGNTLTVTRGFAGSTAATIAAGHSWFVVAAAALEGADVNADTSRPRDRKTNYCQIFKKDVIVSGTMRAVSMVGVSDEYDKQVANRMTEMLRDMEKAVIIGKSSGNTLGTASLYRTFAGIWDSITTNSTSLATISSIGQLEDVIQTGWANGGELDLIVCDNIKHRQLSNLQFARTTVQADSGSDERLKKKIQTIETSYGDHRILRSRWMPSNSMLVVSSNRIHVVPLQGRSFRHKQVADTGDSSKGMIVGEYTVEVKNEAGMCKASA